MWASVGSCIVVACVAATAFIGANGASKAAAAVGAADRAAAAVGAPIGGVAASTVDTVIVQGTVSQHIYLDVAHPPEWDARYYIKMDWHGWVRYKILDIWPEPKNNIFGASIADRAAAPTADRAPLGQGCCWFCCLYRWVFYFGCPWLWPLLLIQYYGGS